MSKPTATEMETALDAARRMRDFGVDPHPLAQSLLYLDERNQRMGDLLQAVDRYLRFGLPETELAKLRRNVQLLREAEQLETENRQQRSMPL